MAVAAALLAGSLVLTACGGDSGTGTEPTSGGSGTDGSGSDLRVGMAYDIGGRGDKSFNDSAAEGLEAATDELGLTDVQELAAEADEVDADKEARLRQLADAGYNAIICVGFAYAGALATVAPDYPDINFTIIDSADATGDNIASYTFREQESAYLVGAIAALTSQTGTIGFVGGVETPLIQKFEAGYRAGAEAAVPDISIVSNYLTQIPDFTGFQDPSKGQAAAEGQYQNGDADVIYAAAGLSNNGVFTAAAAAGAKAIGTDSDQFQTADPSYQSAIIASALKGVGAAVQDFLTKVAAGGAEGGNTELGLAEGGVDYVINDPAVETAVGAQVEEYKQGIIDSDIMVPDTL